MMLFVFLHRYRWGYQIRGDERGFYEKAKIYGRMGDKLLVIEKKPSFQETQEQKVYSSKIVPNFRLPLRNLFDAIKISFFALLIVLKLKERPSFVYAYNQDPENVVFAYIVKILLRVPMVVVYHHINPDRICSIGEGIARRRAEGYSFASSFWRSLLPWLNFMCAKRADVHISLSKSTSAEVMNVLGISKCTVVGNGIDSTHFRDLGLERTFEACFLGRLVPQKGIDILLKAWKKVIDALPNARLLIIGGAEEQVLRSYKRMAKEMGLYGSVTFTGFVSDELLVKLLNQCKLFIFPSRKEGFAQAVSQAMACGLCCILSDIPSLKEIYSDAAVYFPREDYDELAKLIIQYLRDDKSRIAISLKAKEKVKGMTWEKVVEKELRAICSFKQKNK